MATTRRAIGKWHLGMDWAMQPGSGSRSTTAYRKRPSRLERGLSRSRSGNGPTRVGFDYYFGIAASLDMVPYTFIENDRVTALPTEDKAFPMMTGREDGMTRKGPAAADFEAADVLPALTQQGGGIRSAQRAADAKNGQPFFLYLPLDCAAHADRADAGVAGARAG